MNNCIIRTNTASTPDTTGDDYAYGGGVYIWSGSVNMTNCIVQGNIASAASSSAGGGVCLTGGLYDHTLQYANGVGTLSLINCTIAYNNSGGLAGADNSTATIMNTILYFNNGGGAQITGSSGSTGSSTVTYSDIQGGVIGADNIDFNPLFLSSSDLIVAPGSPCVDAGDPDPAFSDTCLPPSLGGVRNDMGAYGGPGACGWRDAAIETEPQSQTVSPGGSVSFTVTASGTPPLNYQWLFNGNPINGATTASYGISTVQPPDAGGYSVVVTNFAGSVTSAAAVLTVQGSLAATATATVVNGYVVEATVTYGGFEYTNTPGVRIIGGGGRGAQAAAVLSNGVVVAVNIANPGDGYSSTPVVVIAPPFIPQPTMSIAPMSLLSFTNATVGAKEPRRNNCHSIGVRAMLASC